MDKSESSNRGGLTLGVAVIALGATLVNSYIIWSGSGADLPSTVATIGLPAAPDKERQELARTEAASELAEKAKAEEVIKLGKLKAELAGIPNIDPTERRRLRADIATTEKDIAAHDIQIEAEHKKQKALKANIAEAEVRRLRTVASVLAFKRAWVEKDTAAALAEREVSRNTEFITEQSIAGVELDILLDRPKTGEAREIALAKNGKAWIGKKNPS